jgi:hypothetical protein
MAAKYRKERKKEKRDATALGRLINDLKTAARDQPPPNGQFTKGCPAHSRNVYTYSVYFNS